MKAFTDLRFKTMALAGCWVLISGISASIPALAERSPATVVSDSGNGTGGQAHKGSSDCPVVSPVLTALVPTYRTSAGDVKKDSTLAEHPTFWVYAPYALTERVQGSLQLLEKDSAGRMAYQPVATVTGTTPGVVGVRLPLGKRLAETQQYKWRFVILCDPTDPTANPSTAAIVSRLPKNPTLEKQLQAAKAPVDRADVYARNKIWYEALTTLAEQRRAKPRDAKISAKWKELLRQGGLSVFDAKPPGQKAP